MSTTRIVHVTTAHPADDVRILHKECASLAAAGFEVYLLAPPATATARQVVEAQGVCFRELSPRGGWAGRLIFRPWSAIRQIRRLGPRVVHFHDPEFLFTGLWLRLRGMPVVFDVHEDFAGVALEGAWIPRPLRRVVSVAIRRLLQLSGLRFSALVAATPAIAQTLPSAKTVIVQNFPRLEEFSSESDGVRAYAVYIGGFSKARGALCVLDAFEQLWSSGIEMPLVLAGSIESGEVAERVKAAERKGIVDYHGIVRRAAVARLLNGAITGICTFLPGPNHTESQPNKLFEYLAAALPVIASDFPLWRPMVEEAGAGYCVDPTDAAAIADAIIRIRELPQTQWKTMSRNAQRVAEQRFSWQTEERVLLELYRTLTQQ